MNREDLTRTQRVVLWVVDRLPLSVVEWLYNATSRHWYGKERK